MSAPVLAPDGREHPWPVVAAFVLGCLALMPAWIVPNGSPAAPLLFPGFLALYLCLLFPHRRAHLATLGVHRPGTAAAYRLAALLLAAGTAGYAVPALLGLARPSSPGALEHLVIFIPLAVYEEVGWRGYLQGQLTLRLGARPAVLLVGVVWALWHSGLFLSGQLLGPAGTTAAGAALFMVDAVLISIVLGCARHLSGSVWPAVVGHAGLNYVQEIGDAVFSRSTSHGYLLINALTGLSLLSALSVWSWRRLGSSRPAGSAAGSRGPGRPAPPGRPGPIGSHPAQSAGDVEDQGGVEVESREQ